MPATSIPPFIALHADRSALLDVKKRVLFLTLRPDRGPEASALRAESGKDSGYSKMPPENRRLGPAYRGMIPALTTELQNTNPGFRRTGQPDGCDTKAMTRFQAFELCITALTRAQWLSGRRAGRIEIKPPVIHRQTQAGTGQQ